jgi:hypothetical protein
MQTANRISEVFQPLREYRLLAYLTNTAMKLNNIEDDTIHNAPVNSGDKCFLICQI